jgi:hypothetical protein
MVASLPDLVGVSAREVSQGGGDLIQGKNVIDRPGGDGSTGHVEMLGRGFILGDHDATHRLHEPDPGGAVGIVTGEDDGYGPVLATDRHRREEHIS